MSDFEKNFKTDIKGINRVRRDDAVQIMCKADEEIE